jgi:pyridinium-3,5-bisthiocarboxylic acid mononucleotide nickel chelatase
MIGWIDAQAGVSGDMLLGALVAAGVPLESLQVAVDELGLGLTLETSATTRAGLAATKISVRVAGVAADAAPGTPITGQPHRTWADVRALLDTLEQPELAHEVFRRLAEAEGAVHGVAPDEVHFHEVGALDALADVVGVCAGFRALGLERLSCSPVSLGSGFAHGAHGPLPVPVPAVLSLLAGAPVQAGAAPFESTTPTGAALLATLVTDWGPLPPMTLGRTGVGAGTRDPHEVTNVVRLVLGDPTAPVPTHHLLETNVDDLDPRLWPGILHHLLDAGAGDAWLTPILMKKGRPAHTLSVLAPSTVLAAVREIVFRETTSLGLRESPVTKHALERTFTTVEVGGQPISVKHAWYAGELVTSTPEWEDVAGAAESLGRPAQQVLREAQTAAKNASAPSPPASGTPTQS